VHLEETLLKEVAPVQVCLFWERPIQVYLLYRARLARHDAKRREPRAVGSAVGVHLKETAWKELALVQVRLFGAGSIQVYLFAVVQGHP
jgi:hypothetical protein